MTVLDIENFPINAKNKKILIMAQQKLIQVSILSISAKSINYLSIGAVKILNPMNRLLVIKSQTQKKYDRKIRKLSFKLNSIVYLFRKRI